MLTKIKEFFTRVFTPKKKLYEEIDAYKSIVLIKNKKIDNLNEQLVEKNKGIQTLNEYIIERDNEISELKNLIINKDREIWDYQDEIHKLRCYISELTEQDEDFIEGESN